jgi:hypothetical protein
MCWRHLVPHWLRPRGSSKKSCAQSVSTAFSSLRRLARFIFISFHERTGYSLDMRALIRTILASLVRGSLIGRVEHSDPPLALTNIRSLKPFFGKSPATSNHALQPTARSRRAWVVRPSNKNSATPMIGVNSSQDTRIKGNLYEGR